MSHCTEFGPGIHPDPFNCRWVKALTKKVQKSDISYCQNILSLICLIDIFAENGGTATDPAMATISFAKKARSAFSKLPNVSMSVLTLIFL